MVGPRGFEPADLNRGPPKPHEAVAFAGRQSLKRRQDADVALRHLDSTPHVAQSTSGRGSAIDARTTRHPGYAISQWKRKRVEEVFGWLKTIGLLHKARHRGEDRVNWMFVFATAVDNLIRLRNLTEAAA
jgi:hypothetical protein